MFYLALSGATTPDQNGPARDGNEVVLHIAQSPRINGASPSDCLVSHPGHSLVVSYPSAVSVSYSPNWLGPKWAQARFKIDKINRAIGLMSWEFANGPGDRGSIPGRVIPKTQKMVLDAALLNSQNYKVCIKGKVEQSR